MKPIVIGIGGGSGCGKSTFCDILEKRLSCRVLVTHMDNYFKKSLPKVKSPITNKEYDDWNHPESLDYNKPLTLLQASINADKYDVILVEGAYLLYYEQIRELMDLKIFIELDSDERMLRRIKRNLAWSTFDEIADYYLNVAKFREQEYALNTKIYADIIINGYVLDKKPLDIILTWINGHR